MNPPRPFFPFGGRGFRFFRECLENALKRPKPFIYGRLIKTLYIDLREFAKVPFLAHNAPKPFIYGRSGRVPAWLKDSNENQRKLQNMPKELKDNA